MIYDNKILNEEQTENARSKLIPVEELEKLSNLFKTLGDLTRIRILFVLKESSLCVCDLASVLNMTQSAISHQLKILRLNNLVKSVKKGKEVFYSLSDDHVKYLFDVSLDHTRE